MNLIHFAILLGAVATTIGTSVVTGLFGVTSARAQAVTALVLSLILGVADAARQGALDHLSWRNIDTITVAAGVVYAASQVAFHGIWRHTGADWLETVFGRTVAAKIERNEQLVAALGRAFAAALAEHQDHLTVAASSPASTAPPAAPSASSGNVTSATPASAAPTP